MAGVHEPVRWNSTGVWVNHIAPPVQLARCYHYFLRSREDAHRKARQWGKKDPVRMLETSDARFWNGVHDPSLHAAWGGRVAASMRRLTTRAGECPPAVRGSQYAEPLPARDPDRRKATSAPTPSRPYRTRVPSRAANVAVTAERHLEPKRRAVRGSRPRIACRGRVASRQDLGDAS